MKDDKIAKLKSYSILFITAGENLISSYKNITHETHTTIFTIFKKTCHWFYPRCLSRRPFRTIYFFRALLWHHYEGKCSPFNQGITQQLIMSTNIVITPMTELSDPSSYVYLICDTLIKVYFTLLHFTLLHNFTSL